MKNEQDSKFKEYVKLLMQRKYFDGVDGDEIEKRYKKAKEKFMTKAIERRAKVEPVVEKKVEPMDFFEQYKKDWRNIAMVSFGAFAVARAGILIKTELFKSRM